VSASPPEVPPAASRVTRGMPRALVVLTSLAAAIVVVAGLRGASGLFGPVFLALVLTVATYPMRRWMDRRMPSWLASLLCLVIVYVMVVVLAICMIVATARFANLLPQYEDEFHQTITSITDTLDKLGVSSRELHDIASSFDWSRLTDVITGILGGALDLVSNLVFILTLILFMTMDGSKFHHHLAAARLVRPTLVEAMERFAQSTRSYLIVSTVFGLIVAVLDTLALALLGIPAPGVWGLLAFLTNYIPNIGFVIGLVPPAILALLEGGPGLMLAVIAVYCVLNVVIQSVIQPKVVGDAVGLSTTLSFFSLVFWAWVLGPLGAVLAVPASLLVRAVLVDADPESRWVLPLISNDDGSAKPKKRHTRREPAPEEAAAT
jgi:AI-2 transport protein TqsA